MSKLYTVYKITNQINQKAYIGMHQTNNLDDDYMGSGTQIKAAIQKYRKENFVKEILFVFDNPIDMKRKEQELVTEEWIKNPFSYNMKQGGIGGFDHITGNVEIKRQEQFRKWIDNNKFLVSERNSKNGAKSPAKFKSGSEHQLKALQASQAPEVVAKRKKTLSENTKGVNNAFFNHLKYINTLTFEEKVFVKGTEPTNWVLKTEFLENEIVRLNKKAWFHNGIKPVLVEYNVGKSNGWRRGRK